MLNISIQVGPLFSIIWQMVKDLALFLVLLIIELCIGFAILNMVVLYLGTTDNDGDGEFISGWNLVETILDGQFYTQFQASTLTLVLFYVFGAVNLVIFLNCVTAILMESYMRLKSRSKAIYALKLIEVCPILLYDETHGGLIAAFSPLNLVNYLFQIPTVTCCSGERKKKCCSDFTIWLFYLPLAAILVSFFICVNAVLLPFGYMYGVFTLLTQKK
jgi:hypothetical protein